MAVSRPPTSSSSSLFAPGSAIAEGRTLLFFVSPPERGKALVVVEVCGDVVVVAEVGGVEVVVEECGEVTGGSIITLPSPHAASSVGCNMLKTGI